METTALKAFLWETLSENAGVVALVDDRVYPEAAPQDEDGNVNSDFPFVVFNIVSTVDNGSVGVNDSRLLSNVLFQVKGVDRNASPYRAGLVSAAVEGAVQGASGEVELEGRTFLIGPCDREGTIDFAEFPHNVRHNHSGGRYRTMIQEL
jgi:hypothetical protein